MLYNNRMYALAVPLAASEVKVLTWPHSSRDARGEALPCLYGFWWLLAFLGLWLHLFLPHSLSHCVSNLPLHLSSKVYMGAFRDCINNSGLRLHFKILILMASAETLFLSKMVSFTGSPGLDVDIFWGPFFSLPRLHSVHFHSDSLILLKYLSLSEK